MFHVDSEVGRLRQVILHRPDLELKRLTPDNAADLLFDDVLWVSRAQAEHDAFAEALARPRASWSTTTATCSRRPWRSPRPASTSWTGCSTRGCTGRWPPTLRAAMDGLDAGGPGAVPGRRDHQARDRRTGPGAEEHRLPFAGPRRVRARPAARTCSTSGTPRAGSTAGCRSTRCGSRPGCGRPSATRPSTAGTRCSPATGSRSGTTAPTPPRPPSRAATSWCSATARCWSG